MKIWFIGIAAFCSIFSIQVRAGEVGQFQLFQGEYQFVNIKGESYWQKALFKIDTKTGELFVCDSVQLDGKTQGKPGHIVQINQCRPFNMNVAMMKQ